MVDPGILDPVERTPADERRAEVREQFYAWNPNLANGLLLSRGVFAYTDPDGPVVRGEDVFARAAADALGRVGVRPAEVDAWDYAHLGGGEVHCTTNVLRDVRPDAAWWRGTA